MANAFLSGYNKRKYRGFVANDAVKANWAKLIVGYAGAGADADGKVYNLDCRSDFNDYALVRFAADSNTRQKEWKEKHTANTSADKWFKVTEAYSSVLTGNAAAAQAVVNVTDASGFAANDWVVLSRDDGTDEFLQISSIATNAITMTANLANAYTTADNAKLMLGYYIYYDDSDDATDYQDGANVFTEFDDFERGNDGDAIGGSWTISTGDVDISTGQDIGDVAGFTGTRAGKWIGGSPIPVATIPATHGDNIAIRWRQYKEDLAITYMAHGNGSSRINLKVDVTENIIYTDGGGANDTGTNVVADTWGLFEVNDFVWATPTYDIWFNGAEIQADAGLQTNAGQKNVFQAYCNNSAGKDVWIDDFIVRNYPDIAGAGFGIEETRPKRHGFINYQIPGIN